MQVIHLDAWVKQCGFMVPVGIGIALALLGGEGNFAPVLIRTSGLVVVVFYILVFIFSRLWMREANKDERLETYRGFLLFIRIALGTSWAVFINVVFYYSGNSGRILIFGVEIGIIASCVIAGPLTFAFASWVPLIVGSFMGVFILPPGAQLSVFVCIFIYTLYTFASLLFLNKKMTDHSLALIHLQQTNETVKILLRDFEENASDWLWETDAAGHLRHASSRFVEVARQPAETIAGDLFAFMAGGDKTLLREGASDVYDQIRWAMARRRPFRDIVVPVAMDGEQRWWSLTGKPITNQNGSFGGYRGVGSDVTAMHRSRQRIAYLARHDTLTELANRAEFSATLSHLLSPERAEGAALLCLDLDQFKAVNDSYGHGLGDSVLRAVAHRLRGAIRDHDVAARLGGDEFSIVLPSNDEFEATAVAERVIDRVTRPYKFGGVTVEIGVSIGIAVAPRDGETTEQLFRNADLALYRAKDSGRGTWRLFDPAMDRHLQMQRSLQRDIKRALQDEQMFVEYQPVVALATRRLVGLETLVRWRHPVRGVIPPDEFISIAERSGLIGTVTAFVLTEATALLRQLPEDMMVAVNLSPLHLREAWLYDQLSAIIAAAGVSPRRVEFEVTESAVLTTDGRTLDNLHRLRQLGCRVAIDDFGTGYSSLATLRGFPFDRLKIDRSFIGDLERPESDAPIVKAIIELGRTLGLRVTAEGVETERHAAILLGYNCVDAQGFLFSPPLAKDGILRLIDNDPAVWAVGGAARPAA